MITFAPPAPRTPAAKGLGWLGSMSASLPSPSLPAETTITAPAALARRTASSTDEPGAFAAQAEVDHRRARSDRAVDAGGDVAIAELARLRSVGAAARPIGAQRDDRGVVGDADDAGVVARRGGDHRHVGAVIVERLDRAVAGNVAAGRVDPAGEFGAVGIDAGVDDARSSPRRRSRP